MASPLALPERLADLGIEAFLRVTCERTRGHFLAPTTGGGDAAFRAAISAGLFSARLLTSSSSPTCTVGSISERVSIWPVSVPTCKHHGSTRHHPQNCQRFWLRGPTTDSSSRSRHAAALLPFTARTPNVGRTRSAQLVRPTGKLVSTTPHTLQPPAQKPFQWSSHPHTTHPHTSHTHAHTSTTHTTTTTTTTTTPPHHSTAHPSRANGNRRRKRRRSAQQEPLGEDEVPFHQEVGTLSKNRTAAWSRPRVPAMRSARVPFRVGKLRLVQSNRHPPREFGKHTKDVSQKQRRRAPPHNIDTSHR